MYEPFLYLITVLIWGTTWLAIKFQLGVVPPEISIVYRFALAGLILFLFCIARKLSLKFDRRAHSFFAIQGLFLFSLNYILVYYSEFYLTSGLVSMIFSTIILFNVLFGALFLHNPIRYQVLLGAGMGMLGLGFVFSSELGSFNLSDQRLFGAALAMISVISASLGNIISARNQRFKLPVVQTNAFGMVYGAAFTLLFSFVRGITLTFDTSAGYVVSLLFLAIFGSVIAFGTYLTLLGRIGPDRAAYVTILFPIIALFLSTLFEGLRWNLYQLAGVTLVILGNIVVLTNRHWMLFRKQIETQNESDFSKTP